MTAPTTFAELGLSPPILTALAELVYEAPTSIQGRTIPPLLAGRDLVGQAQTGTGKTAAFALPILERVAIANEAGVPGKAIGAIDIYDRSGFSRCRRNTATGFSSAW